MPGTKAALSYRRQLIGGDVPLMFLGNPMGRALDFIQSEKALESLRFIASSFPFSGGRKWNKKRISMSQVGGSNWVDWVDHYFLPLADFSLSAG